MQDCKGNVFILGEAVRFSLEYTSLANREAID